MRMYLLLAACVFWCAAAVIAAEPVAAEPAQPAAEAPAAGNQASPRDATALPLPPMDEQMLKAKADYEAATKNLTPEQLAALAALEQEFAATIDADMKILFRSAEMEHCLKNDRFFKVDQNVHVPNFMKWRKSIKDAQTKEQTAHRIKRQQYDYVPLKVLNEYYIYQQKMLVMAGKYMVYQQMQNGDYAGTNCDELAARLKSGE